MADDDHSEEALNEEDKSLPSILRDSELWLLFLPTHQVLIDRRKEDQDSPNIVL